MKKTVLLAGFDAAEKKELQHVILPLGYRIKVAKTTDYGRQIGAILGILEDASEPVSYEGSIDRLMLMAGFERRDLDLFLQALRKSKVAPIPYKAMLTPTNAGWRLSELFEEIKKEHEIMHNQSGKKP